jgi:hypothetical protein
MFLTLLIQLSEACTIACKDQKKTNSSEEHIIIRQKKKKKSFENPKVARYLPG